MAMGGVSCVRPPKGMSTVAAPIVESKRSERPLLEATLRSVTRGAHLLGERVAGPGALVVLGSLHAHGGGLGRAVGGEELAAHVHDGLAAPAHAQAGLLGDGGHDGRLEVLLAGVVHELVHVLGRQGHGHALLGLGDGELGAVEALVLLGHEVEVDVQAVCQLADGHGDAACAKVVAALDQAARVLAAEEALELALDGRVALLDLGAVLLEGLDVVGLGGAGGATDAVAAGAAAEKHDLVAGRRALATDVGCRGGAHDGRRSPCAWPRSRGGRARRPGRWPGRSGCRSWSSRRRRWSRACAAGACPPWSGTRGPWGRPRRSRAWPGRRSCGRRAGRGWRRRCRWPRRQRARSRWGGCGSRS